MVTWQRTIITWGTGDRKAWAASRVFPQKRLGSPWRISTRGDSRSATLFAFVDCFFFIADRCAEALKESLSDEEEDGCADDLGSTDAQKKGRPRPHFSHNSAFVRGATSRRCRRGRPRSWPWLQQRQGHLLSIVYVLRWRRQFLDACILD